MASRHPSFLIDLAGRAGPAVIAATLVSCLLELKFNPLHITLIVLGAAMIAMDHFATRQKT